MEGLSYLLDAASRAEHLPDRSLPRATTKEGRNYRDYDFPRGAGLDASRPHPSLPSSLRDILAARGREESGPVTSTPTLVSARSVPEPPSAFFGATEIPVVPWNPSRANAKSKSKSKSKGNPKKTTRKRKRQTAKTAAATAKAPKAVSRSPGPLSVAPRLLSQTQVVGQRTSETTPPASPPFAPSKAATARIEENHTGPSMQYSPRGFAEPRVLEPPAKRNRIASISTADLARRTSELIASSVCFSSIGLKAGLLGHSGRGQSQAMVEPPPPEEDRRLAVLEAREREILAQKQEMAWRQRQEEARARELLERELVMLEEIARRRRLLRKLQHEQEAEGLGHTSLSMRLTPEEREEPSQCHIMSERRGFEEAECLLRRRFPSNPRLVAELELRQDRSQQERLRLFEEERKMASLRRALKLN